MVDSNLAAVAAVVFVVGALVGVGASSIQVAAPTADTAPQPADDLPTNASAGVVPFESEAAFAEYVQRGRAMDAGGHVAFLSRSVTVATDDAVEVTAEPTATPMPTAEPEAVETAAGDAGGSAPSGDEARRTSGTNVQETGLDEPDIVKTGDGHVYYAPAGGRYGEGAGDETHVISTADPAQPAVVSDVGDGGRLLLAGDVLVVIEDDDIVGYDVSDPESPTETWERDLESRMVTARLYDGRLYLVTRSGASADQPCPVEPLGADAAVACDDIYHPREQIPVDSTYTALAIDPGTGEVRDATGFVGSGDGTTVYMSRHGLYVTYTRPASTGERYVDYLLAESDRLPASVESRLREVAGYNLSDRATMLEARAAVEAWLSTLEPDRRATVATNLRNGWEDYLARHQRDLVHTGVVRVDVDGWDLGVAGVGEVPGRPLNQFSLDEYDGTLRVTTTIPAAGGAESRNDLYVLDNESLEVQGSARDMGKNERVYAVRYVGETAYVVTFRRVDPFHVVDLSDPTDPEEVGQLELPGFSSYLHPIDGETVLGVGRQDGQVKAVLFDVSDPGNPQVEDDFVLEERWSAIAESHHAFLLDRRHGVFFLPGRQGGYVMNYTGGDLSLETRVGTDSPASRALYVGDYMYVLAQGELVAVDETDWTRTATVELE